MSRTERTYRSGFERMPRRQQRELRRIFHAGRTFANQEIKEETKRAEHVRRNPRDFLRTLPELSPDGKGIAIVSLAIEPDGGFSEIIPIGIRLTRLGPDIYDYNVPRSEYVAYDPKKVIVFIDSFNIEKQQELEKRANELSNLGWHTRRRDYPEQSLIVAHRPNLSS